MAFDIEGIKDWAVDIVLQAGRWVASKAKGAVQEYVGTVNQVMPNMLPTATAAMAELSFRGSQGNFATTTYPIVLKAEFLRVADPIPARYGYPTNEFLGLGGLSGFCLVKDAKFSISGTVDEEVALEEFFNNGAFLDWSNIYIPEDLR